MKKVLVLLAMVVVIAPIQAAEPTTGAVGAGATGPLHDIEVVDDAQKMIFYVDGLVSNGKLQRPDIIYNVNMRIWTKDGLQWRASWYTVPEVPTKEKIADTCLDMSLLPELECSNVIRFHDINGGVILKLSTNGEIFVKGKLIEKDEELVDALREFIVNQNQKLYDELKKLKEENIRLKNVEDQALLDSMIVLNKLKLRKALKALGLWEPTVQGLIKSNEVFEDAWNNTNEIDTTDPVFLRAFNLTTININEVKRKMVELDKIKRTEKECKAHEKVFSNLVYLSYPAKYPWICRLCGFKGVDQDEWENINEYEELTEKFKDNK